MNIIVCVKQVPNTDKIIFNEEGTLNRKSAESIINPFDIYGVEEGLKIKEIFNGNLTVISMGIKGASEQLKDFLAMGADRVILLNDRYFAGSDTLATSKILSKCIKKIGNYNLVICGKQAIDGDTAQVGPSLAEKLNIPHITCVNKIIDIKRNVIILRRRTDKGSEILKIDLPALITVLKDINTPRIPSLKSRMQSRKKEIEIWSFDDIDVKKDEIGLNGSPTRVIETFTVKRSKKAECIYGNEKELARILTKKIMEFNI